LTRALWLIRILLLFAITFGNIQFIEGSTEGLSKIKMGTCTSLLMLITYDNNPYDARLRTSWGFSCVVRCDQKSILFDTGGNSTILLDNMGKLKIDSKEIDIVVFSHIHGDHTGGLAGFLKKNNQVTVYLPKSFPQSFKNGVKSYGTSMEEVDAPREIIPGIYTTGELGRGIKEQSLIVKTSRGLVVITGCAHPGIVTIIREAKKIAGDKVYLVLGGFHLGGTPTTQINAIIQNIKMLGVEKVAPCHCTGEEAMTLFRRYFGKNYIETGVGTIIPVAK